MDDEKDLVEEVELKDLEQRIEFGCCGGDGGGGPGGGGGGGGGDGNPMEPK
jgi:hypothetical protein